MLPLSICLIAKNEQNCIKKALSSLIPLLNAGAELVITDTGSTDSTKEIAAEFTQQIYDFVWCDDFSAARNFCADRATNDWILFLDCDESLCSSHSLTAAASLQAFIENTSPDTEGMITLQSPNSSGNITVDKLARLYHRSHYHYKGIIHEQLFPIDENAMPQYRFVGLTFDHSGYRESDILDVKSKRNITLLKKAYNTDPTDTYTLFQLGQAYRNLKQFDDALQYFEKALSFDVNPSLDYVKTLVESYGYTLLDLDRPQDVLSLYGVYESFSDRADFVFLIGLANMKCGQIKEAIDEFKKAVTIPDYSVEGTNSYLAFYNLGVIYECIGNTKLAIEYYQKCQNYPPTQKRLSTLLP